MRWRRILRMAAFAVAALLLAGIAYEQIGRWRDRRRAPQTGTRVDIGGRALNIFCSGEGVPTVILESPGAGPGLAWDPIQRQVATFTRACWYDRAGEGWSDPGPFPRTSAALARDLHELLGRAHIPPPYLLAGASFGGLTARVYAARYPQEVAGVVLADSAHEDEPKRAPKFFLAPTPPRSLWFPLHLAFQTAARIGLLRLMQPARGDQVLDVLRKQPESIASSALTGIVEPESYDQARAVKSLGDIPLIVLTAGKPVAFDDPEQAREAAAYQQVVISEMHAQLARLSSRGRQIVVQNSDHAINDQAPDAVVAAIRELVASARQNQHH